MKPTECVTVEEIRLAAGRGRFMNGRIFEFLRHVVSLVSASLPGFLQEQMVGFQCKNAKRSKAFAELSHDTTVLYDVRRVEAVEDLIAEEKFNQKLLRFVRLYRVYLDVNHEQGLAVPYISTSWIYQDFPELRNRAKSRTRPATVLCELLFDRYTLRKDQSVAKTVWVAEQEAQWQKSTPLKRNFPPPTNYQPISEQCFASPNGTDTSRQIACCVESLGTDCQTRSAPDIPAILLKELGNHDDDTRRKNASCDRSVDRGSETRLEPEIPSILLKEFGKVPTTEELREVVANYMHKVYTGKNNGTVGSDDILAYTDELVDAKMTVQKLKQEDMYASRHCPAEVACLDHVTAVCHRSKPIKRRFSESFPECDHAKASLSCAEPHRATKVRVCDSGERKCVKASFSRSTTVTGSHVTKVHHVTPDDLWVCDSKAVRHVSAQVRVVEQTCYSDRIY